MREPLRYLAGILLPVLLLAAPARAQQPAHKGGMIQDPAAFAAAEFGAGCKLDRAFAPLYGDLDGDGLEDVVLVAKCTSVLAGEKGFGYKVVDPYDAYYGNGDPTITTQFTLHFDGSARNLLIVFDWRHETPAKKPLKPPTKFIIINLPFEKLNVIDFRSKKMQYQTIETIDRTTLHALVIYTNRKWVWAAQGMDGDDELMKMPDEDPIKMPPQKP